MHLGCNALLCVPVSSFENIPLCVLFTCDIIVGINFIFLGKDEGKDTDLCITIPKYSHEADYFECKETIKGNFLRITWVRGQQSQLSLCEVEVFQTKIGKHVLPSYPTEFLTNSLTE